MTDKIALKGVKMEDFVQYKKPSMFLITSVCDWKCCYEHNFDINICQNSSLVNTPSKEFSYESIYNAYIKNDITSSLVIGGLEPFLQFEEVYGLILYMRNNGVEDDIVIYTGYYLEEIKDYINLLKQVPNIIIKVGRYNPNKHSRYDEVLGVTLASDNQYGVLIS